MHSISFPKKGRALTLLSSRSICPEDIFYEIHSRSMGDSIEAQFRLPAQEIHEREQPPLIVCADVSLKIFMRIPFLYQHESVSVFNVFIETITQAAPFDPRGFDHPPHRFQKITPPFGPDNHF
jgi:hypothetical protein